MEDGVQNELSVEEGEDKSKPPVPQRALSLFIASVNGIVAYMYYWRLSREK